MYKKTAESHQYFQRCGKYTRRVKRGGGVADNYEGDSLSVRFEITRLTLMRDELEKAKNKAAERKRAASAKFRTIIYLRRHDNLTGGKAVFESNRRMVEITERQFKDAFRAFEGIALERRRAIWMAREYACFDAAEQILASDLFREIKLSRERTCVSFRTDTANCRAEIVQLMQKCDDLQQAFEQNQITVNHIRRDLRRLESIPDPDEDVKTRYTRLRKAYGHWSTKQDRLERRLAVQNEALGKLREQFTGKGIPSFSTTVQDVVSPIVAQQIITRAKALHEDIAAFLEQEVVV